MQVQFVGKFDTLTGIARCYFIVWIRWGKTNPRFIVRWLFAAKQ